MKKFLYLISFLAFAATTFAQIPNAGFENWTSMTGYDLPDLWGNLNPSTASTGVFTAIKGTSGPASGAFYIKLTTKDAGGSIKPGLIVSGLLDPVTLMPLSGFPYTSRPEKLTGKWQHMGYGADAATISAWLTKWNSVSHMRDTIASLSATAAGMLHTWGSFSFPYSYSSSSNPDTAVVMISSSGKLPVKNSFIWIDDLAFDGTVTGIESGKLVSTMSVFPNPASDIANIRFNSSKTEQAAIRLLDNIGNLVYQSKEDISAGPNQLTVNLESEKIHSGIFFLQVSTSEGTVTRKLVVRK